MLLLLGKRQRWPRRKRERWLSSHPCSQWASPLLLLLSPACRCGTVNQCYGSASLWCWCGSCFSLWFESDPTCHYDAFPAPTFQFAPDLDHTNHFFPDLDPPMLQNDNLRLHFFTLMRVRILFFTLMPIRLLPFNLLGIWILSLAFPQIWTFQCSKWSSKAFIFSLWCGPGSIGSCFLLRCGSGSCFSLWCGSGSSFTLWCGSVSFHSICSGSGSYHSLFPRFGPSNVPKWSSKAFIFSLRCGSGSIESCFWLWCGSGSCFPLWCGSGSSFPLWCGSGPETSFLKLCRSGSVLSFFETFNFPLLWLTDRYNNFLPVNKTPSW